MIARAVTGALALVALLLLGAWLTASFHESEAARLVGNAPEQATEAEAARALRELEKAQRFQPDAGPRQVRGTILLARGETAAAAREFEAVVAAEPKNGITWGYLVGTLRELDPQRSREAERRARELIPDLRKR